jgi:Flp pilus assembly pilin Flp
MTTASNERGASAVEYSLIVVAIAAIVVTIVFSLGRLSESTFDDTCTSLAAGDFSATATCS